MSPGHDATPAIGLQPQSAGGADPADGWVSDEFGIAAAVAVGLLADYVRDSAAGTTPVMRRTPPAELAERLELHRWIREGGMSPASFGAFLTRYLGDSTRLHHPGYMAHQVAVPDFPAALADLVHGTVNNPMAIYEMGASGATVEMAVIRWMTEKIGWTSGAGGALTHGGSLANLTALLAARVAAVPDVWSQGSGVPLAVLAPHATHYSIARAAGIMGIGVEGVIPVASDEFGRILPAALAPALERARAAGRRPIAVVANACVTGSGLYDDLAEIGAFCRRHGLWFHVDAAHGASALLSPTHRHLLAGIEQADSVIWDAHKMLRTSGLSAAVLVQREADLTRAFQQEASYLFYGEHSPGQDLITRTVECTKATLGLKIFLNLAWRGERGLGDYVAEQYDKTRRFWHLIRAREGFECPYEPESNILCFRHRSLDDDGHVWLREQLMDEGDFHLSSTDLAERRHLRMAVMAPATDERTVVRLLDTIEALVQTYHSTPPGATGTTVSA